MDFKDLAGLAEPAGKVVDAIRAACASVYEPTRIRREASAEADAAVVLAKGEAAALAVRERAKIRLIEAETRRQHNLDSITRKAEKALPGKLSDKPADPDWIFHFLNECMDTSNEVMQELWARLLAGELSSPGSYSRRTVSFIKLLEPSDAKSFVSFCRLVTSGDGVPIVDRESEFVSQRMGLTSHVLDHLDTIGLVRAPLMGQMEYRFDFRNKPDPKRAVVKYFERKIILDVTKATPAPDGAHQVVVGNANFTYQGRELARLVERAPDDAVFEYLLATLAKFNPTAVVTPG